MKDIGIAIATIFVTGLVVLTGTSGKQIWFITGPRSAAITLGVIGFLLCTISVGKFIGKAPAHPLSILGYVFGTVALVVFLGQIFQWKLPFIRTPGTALYVLAACILVKTVVGRFSHLLR